MATVYVASAGEYSDYRIVGVYSTEKLAEERVKCFQGLYENAQVKEYELDEPLDHDHPAGLELYRVDIQRDGAVTHVVLENHDYSVGACPSNWTLDPYYNSRPRWWSMNMWAQDKDHAVKIAGEWRTRLLAENLWGIDIPVGAPLMEYTAAQERIAACLGTPGPCAGAETNPPA